MLVGAYPFEDPDDPRNIRKTIQVLLKNIITERFIPLVNFRDIVLYIYIF